MSLLIEGLKIIEGHQLSRTCVLVLNMPIARHGPVHFVVIPRAAGGLQISILVGVEVSPMMRVIELPVEQLSSTQEVVQFVRLPLSGFAMGAAN